MKTADSLELLFIILALAFCSALWSWSMEREYQAAPYTSICVRSAWVEAHKSYSNYFITSEDSQTYELPSVQIYGQLEPKKCYDVKFLWGKINEVKERP